MSTQAVGARIEACSSCQQPLPLCDAGPYEAPITWTCAKCGHQQSGVLAPDYALDELRNVRREAITLDKATVPAPDPALLDFAVKLDPRDGSSVEKRTAHRHSLITLVPAQELDDRLACIGEAFMITCRNISQSGICLLHDRAIVSDFCIVDLAHGGQPSMQILVHILRRRPLGPYLDIGAEFVHKLAAASAESAP